MKLLCPLPGIIAAQCELHAALQRIFRSVDPLDAETVQNVGRFRKIIKSRIGEIVSETLPGRRRNAAAVTQFPPLSASSIPAHAGVQRETA